ncbi:hypothetical protein [Candidatus Amarolinea aalborgensis]|jgi:hypothetical protein|uniref:hypothetical protein n=1 Tax=Candidatus Amarolinea aalborgensis TaxID=2249329 RepID=UPI003BF9D52F
MALQSITVNLPENLYERLKQASLAMHVPLDEVLVRALQVGSPPSWEDAPALFQADLAALDRLDDDYLWRLTRSTQLNQSWLRYHELLDKNGNGTIAASERAEIERLRTEADRFVLRKAHAAALLRWRGHQVPAPDPQITLLATIYR